MYFAVVGAGVNVALVCGGGGGEVAADEGFEDAVAAEGDEGAVVRVRDVGGFFVGGEAVVEVCGKVLAWVSMEDIGGGSGYEFTCGLIFSPSSVLTMRRRSQSLHVWSLPLLITYRPSPLESIYVNPSVCPRNMPAGRMLLKLLRSQTLSVVSSEPEYKICGLILSPKQTALTSS